MNSKKWVKDEKHNVYYEKPPINNRPEPSDDGGGYEGYDFDWHINWNLVLIGGMAIIAIGLFAFGIGYGFAWLLSLRW